MRVRSARRPAPYLNGADQRRMLAMVGALALVLFAAKWASNPANWYWIAPPAAADPGEAAAPDFSVRQDGPLPPGTVRVAAVPPAAGSGGEADDEDAAPLRAPFAAAARDRRVGLTRAERAALDAGLDRLSEDPPAPAADAPAVSFPALMRDPDYYRGRPVRVAGQARGVTDRRDGRVDLWVFPPDGDDNPVHVRAARADGLPRGELLGEPVPVTVDGVFFKLEGYAARGEGGEGRLHVAPLVIADAVRRARVVAAVPQTPDALPWVVLGVLAAALAGGGLLVWRWKAADRRYERTTLSRLSAAADPAVGGAGGEPLRFSADDATPETFLAGLSEPPPGSPSPLGGAPQPPTPPAGAGDAT